ncbi:hypothetical protein EV175_002190 [Coemansia sp. RSA 1933]|nr:hypothetical protein EV175_002190 [Coemansia sp. RSA 1933]
MGISKCLFRHLRIAIFTTTVFLVVYSLTYVSTFSAKHDEHSSFNTHRRLHYHRRAQESSSASTEAIKSFQATNATLLVQREFEAGNEPKRMIFIGDIHGCIDQFNSLLEEVQYQQGQDQIVLVGDLVAKGPDSIAVVQKAISIGAWCVRGNHDDRVIRWREFLDGPGQGLSTDEIASLEDAGDLPYDDFKVTKEHYTIALNLTTDEFNFLQSFPAIMAPPAPYTEWIVVHAGLEANKPILNQTDDTCWTMRNVAPTGPTSSTKEGVAWFDVWASKMTLVESLPPNPLASSSTSTEENFLNINFNKLIYGHDASRGLQIHNFTKGLDSRCVYGGNLTAFILPGEQLVQVGCIDYDGAVPADGD